jgi:transcriptional regulator with GAF, ATPase, and Fis domain
MTESINKEIPGHTIFVANDLSNRMYSILRNSNETLAATITFLSKMGLSNSANDLKAVISEDLRSLTGIKDALLILPESAADHPIYNVLVDQAFIQTGPVSVKRSDILEILNEYKMIKLECESRIREIISVGLSRKDKRLGVMLLLTPDRNTLTEPLNTILEWVAMQVSIFLSNISALEHIQRQEELVEQLKKNSEPGNVPIQSEQKSDDYDEIIGSTGVMNKIFKMVSQVSQSASSVLILGETGTGKELIARAIHHRSLRKDKALVKINCATLPPNLIESELFGHERGSFTGATERRIGKFELANNGTLFLDEIGELPMELQVKLLRVLQEKEIERIGGRIIIKTDVRIIAATNRDLLKEVQAGNFRSDLYFRLNVFPITIPPLRERKEDINLLAMHFLKKHENKTGLKVLGFSSKVFKQLNAYNWPGNVREMEHLIERSILLTSKPVISHVNIPQVDQANQTLLTNGRVKSLDEVEREHIMSVLRLCKGKVSGIGGAAETLNIPSTTLGSKIKRLGITKEFTSA